MTPHFELLLAAAVLWAAAPIVIARTRWGDPVVARIAEEQCSRRVACGWCSSRCILGRLERLRHAIPAKAPRPHPGVVVAAALLSVSAQAGAETAAPVVVPLSPYLGLPSITLRANGTPGRFLLDSAGGLTTISPEFAQSISCVPWGRIVGHRMRGDRVDVARCEEVSLDGPGMHLAASTVGVWDFKRLLPPDAPALQGVLALDALEGKVITLDLSGSQLVIENEKSVRERLVGAREVPARFMRDAQGWALSPLVGVDTAKGRLWLELDCGSDAALMLSKPAMEAFTGPSNSPVTVQLAPDVKIVSKPGTGDFILDGSIGVPALKHWIVTIDLRHERVWFKARSTKSPPGAREDARVR